VFITARQFIQNPENWASHMRRLAARDVPPGGSFLRNSKSPNQDESPYGYA